TCRCRAPGAPAPRPLSAGRRSGWDARPRSVRASRTPRQSRRRPRCRWAESLAHLLDLVRGRLLGGVWMLRPGVHPQLLLNLTAERVLRQHAHDGLLDDAVGLLLHQVTDRAGPQTARVTRVPVGELVLQLVATDGDLVGIDDDDEVATVDIWGERRLVLAAQQVGCRDGEPAEHHVGGVDDIPRTRDVTRLRRVR